jgi:VanZ family protein
MVRKIARQTGRWLPVLLWMGVIFYVSSQPDLPHHPQGLVDVVIKKSAHMAEYALLAGLVWWAWPKEGHRWLDRALFGAFVLSVLYGVSDELHQSFVPGRTARWADVGFDTVGVAMALAVVSMVVRRKQAR